MMTDPNTWLNEIIRIKDFSGPRYQRLCWLIEANQGLSIRGWGVIGYYGSHQRGLDMEDALELQACVEFMRGMEYAGVHVFEALHPHLERYHNQTEHLNTNAARGE